MKKMILPVVMLAIVVFSAPVYAIDIDVSTLELSELLELRQTIETEVMMRLSGGASSINPGAYVTGKDIKAGQYNITCTSDYLYYAVFDDEEAYNAAVVSQNIEGSTIVYSCGSGETFFVGLEDGKVLLISDGSGVVTEASQSTWAVE